MPIRHSNAKQSISLKGSPLVESEGGGANRNILNNPLLILLFYLFLT